MSPHPSRAWGLAGSQKEAPSAEAGGNWGRRYPPAWYPPQQMVDTWYLSKGRGLPKRLVTTATQCWEARTYTLCWADCNTCSSRVSCSLERSTLMISGTCGWWALVRPGSRQPGSQVLSIWGHGVGWAAQELQSPSWGWGREGSLVPSGSVWSTEANRHRPTLYLGYPSLRRSDQGKGGQWVAMQERKGRLTDPQTEAGMGQEREGRGPHCRSHR